jgi:hypothetical protein
METVPRLAGWLQGHSDGLMCYIEDYTHDIDDCVGFVQHSKLDYAHSSTCVLGIHACIYLAPDCHRACVCVCVCVQFARSMHCRAYRSLWLENRTVEPSRCTSACGCNRPVSLALAA